MLCFAWLYQVSEVNFPVPVYPCVKGIIAPSLESYSPPWNHSPPSIDLHRVSVILSISCRDDSLYLTVQAGEWLRGLLLLPHQYLFHNN